MPSHKPRVFVEAFARLIYWKHVHPVHVQLDMALSSLFWAAAPKGRCPVGHRGEFPDVHTSVRMSPPEVSQALNSH